LNAAKMAAMGPRDRRSILVAALVFAVVLTIGLLVLSVLGRAELQGRRRAASELARGSAFAIEQRFDFAHAAASTLGVMIAAGSSHAELDAVAREELVLAGGRLSLQLAPGGVIRHMWPEEGNEAARGFDLLRSPLHARFVEEVIASRAPLLYGPFSLVQGGTGFALRIPVFAGRPGAFWGLASAIIRLADLLEESRIGSLTAAGFDWAIWREGGAGTPGEVVASSPHAPARADAVIVPVELPGQRWQLGVIPAQGWHELESPVIFGLVVLTALLAALLAYRAQALPALLRHEVEARTRQLELAHADQRKAEEAQRQSQKLESLGLLAGGVAHDFNNLLVGILGYADLLVAEATPGTTAHEAGTTIGQAARRASELTRQLLALARLGQHREERVDLHAVVEEVTKLLGRTLDKSIRLETRLHAGAHTVRGDPGQLQQVILNLAVNARDAMPAGGTLTLETATVDGRAGSGIPGLAPGEYVALHVTDTGTGIPGEHLARIFDPFFTTKPVGKGSGLGLATAFGIAKGHGGSIRVESEAGAGSTFTVYLPALAGDAAATPAPEDPPRRGSGVVLVVDDEEIVRRTADRVLASLGYEPALVAGGREALAWLSGRADPPAAVLLDLAMPEMDGRTCFGEMRKRHPDLRVVVCSGFSQTGGAQELLSAGAVAFVQKPYRTIELARALELAVAPAPAPRAGMARA
jgi:signal transduction histidine kinase/ActR/RegA family two-component response regulator